MVIKFVVNQIISARDFYSGKKKWKRFLLIISLGTVFQFLADTVLKNLGATNSLTNIAVSTIIWIPVNCFIISFLLKLSALKQKIKKPIYLNALKISNFLFSFKNQKEVFEPIAADWQEEYFEALFKKEIRKARWINVRYTYAFLAAMIQKSLIGNLIEFVIKIAK